MRHHTGRWAFPLVLAALTTGLVAAPAAADVSPVPAQDVPAQSYVALGDSYASGPLIPVQTGQPAGCLRSTNNYPAIVGRTLGVPGFQDVSCSGATTENLAGPQAVSGGENPPQLDALSEDTELVTLTIGGNDIGFSSIISECAVRSPQQPAGAACRDFFTAGGNDQLAERIDATAPKVAAALEQIGERAPDARVLVVGYPALLPDEGPGCFPLVPFSPGDVAYFRETEKRLNAMLADEADSAGADFVDTYTPSIGHDMCQLPGVKWIEGLVPTAPAAPVHPNALGTAGMAAAVVEAVSEESVPVLAP
ncbi:SGNH/GDSL hydrolase family protein [Pseudonocardia xinjiangensis]|uniref:SGNH/GDSL hydrolase family protein n=1 Tax=Pseudonocardia xinjiangensis TaxID=75289 RepID=UPI0028A5FD80|nr:SGNH/GDSL hydrolase family protein [Pseudonocardia xinjiangensis]